MARFSLIDATELTFWADRRDAQDRLPELIRRLVLATVDRVLRISFRAQEGVHFGGWDGILMVETGNAFVPDGLTAWELGTSKDVKGKADDDYDKRSDDPLDVNPSEAAFVFVTLRRWGGKTEWANEKRKQGIWQDVRAYDADDLETWLALAPAVEAWLAALVGRDPDSVTNLEVFWLEWAMVTRPPLIADLILSGREDAAARIHQWLTEAPGVLSIQADTREEAIAFLAASIQQLPGSERQLWYARSILVHDVANWRRITTSEDPLLLLPVFEQGGVVAQAVHNGHHVFIPLGRDTAASPQTIVLTRLRRDPAKNALLEMGFSDESAGNLATLARRSLLSLRRKLAISPELQQPEWARPGEAYTMLAPMLAGSWNGSEEGDREVLAALSQRPYDEVSHALIRWANESDPPIRRIGSVWYIVSKQDAWSLLARFLSAEDLARFEQIAYQILGVPDPSLELPPEHRWAANLQGITYAHSDLLRQGIADTLALMGALGAEVQLADGSDPRRYVERIVRRLLIESNQDGRMLASLSSVLPLLAEAAPSVFLDAVDITISRDEQAILGLFTDSGDNPIFTSSAHSALLWSLENLAWNPDYLGHVALLLARLHRLDPGGRLSNRPLNSLRGIFLLWHPQTAATLDRRFRILNALRERLPDVAWSLLMSLLPQAHDIGLNAHSPQHRDWKPDPQPSVTYGQLREAAQRIAMWLLEDAGTDGQRWTALIERTDDLPPEARDVIVERLMDIELNAFDDSDRSEMSDAIRAIVSRHRRFSDEDWSLPADEVAGLFEVYQRFQPENLIWRYQWLFSDRQLLDDFEGDDWRERSRAVSQARLDAVTEVYQQGGFRLLYEMIDNVESPFDFGFTVGQSGLLADKEGQFLRQGLASDTVGRRQVIRGYIKGRLRSEDWEWVSSILSEAPSWSPEQQAEFLLSLPFEPNTWEFVDDMSSEVQSSYWQQVLPYAVAGPAEAQTAARKLLEYDRPFIALRLLADQIKELTSAESKELVMQALETAARTSPDQHINQSAMEHDVAQLLDLLEMSDDVERNRLAGVEWAFLPLFRFGKRRSNVLHAELSNNPVFFAEVVSWVYKPDDTGGEDTRELTEEERVRAALGRELLRSWKGVPGRQDDGSIEAQILSDWVKQARHALDDRRRNAIGDYVIGEVLSKDTPRPDINWPGRSIRDIVERIASKDLERGFESGVYYNHRVTWRTVTDGGNQERELAARYFGYANAVADQWPRTAAMLRRIGERYRTDADREDLEAELREDLWD